MLHLLSCLFIECLAYAGCLLGIMLEPSGCSHTSEFEGTVVI